MTAIITRAGKGSPLTNAEVDANFTNLNAGKPEISAVVSKLGDNIAAIIPAGTTAQRPAYTLGALRYNTTLGLWEGSTASAWEVVGSQPAPETPLMDGVASAGVSAKFSRGDHIHPTDTSRAPSSAATAAGTSFTPAGNISSSNVQAALQELETDLTSLINAKANINSPSFSGVPTAPTPAAGTSTTQVATTAFVGTEVNSKVLGAFSDATPLVDGIGSAGASNTISRGDHSHPYDTTKADIASPTFTGTPTAPTPVYDNNSTQLATTAFVRTAIVNYSATLSNIAPGMDGTASAGAGSSASRYDHIHPSDTSKAPVASPTFTGTPAAPTAPTATNSTQIATTAFVRDAITTYSIQLSSSTPGMNGSASAGVSNTAARGDHIHPTDTSRAPIASPTFTGTPSAPTASAGTNTTQIATTAFVLANAASISSTIPKMNGNAAVGVELACSRGDHVHPTDTSRAPIASPTFTGTPSAPTASAGTNTTQIATTAFVLANGISPYGSLPAMNGSASAGASGLYSRGDHVHPVDTSRFAAAGGTISGAVTMSSTLSVSGQVQTNNGIRVNNSTGMNFFSTGGELGSVIGNADGVSIFVVTPSIIEYRFSKSGIGYCTGGWQQFSDVRLKDNIATITNPLDRLALITGCTFNRNDLDNASMAGVIAQDVQRALPEGVSIPDKEKGLLAVDPMAVIALLVESVKALQLQIAELKGD